MAGEIYIDPRFNKPPNVIDVRDANGNDGSFYYDEGVAWSEDVGEEVVEDYIPNPPTSFIVVSQTVRISSDGSQVVDVVLELPDQIGVKEYDIRVAKV